MTREVKLHGAPILSGGVHLGVAFQQCGVYQLQSFCNNTDGGAYLPPPKKATLNITFKL